MGDMGDDFRAFRQMKNEERARVEPKRFDYAMEKLTGLGAIIRQNCDTISVEIPNRGEIVFWPYTGWFCGKHPLGHVKGRGVMTLESWIKQLIKEQENGKKDA